MRILDKHYDFYDCYQDYTDNMVFDRRKSFVLTKDIICRNLYEKKNYFGNYLILIQCGGTFWLELLMVTARNNFTITDFTVQLLAQWRNYNKPNKLLVIEEVTSYDKLSWRSDQYKYDVIMNNKDIIVKAIDNNDYDRELLSTITVWDKDYNRIKCNLPILKSSGLISVIDPFEFFIAIEEYFSIEKTKAETTEPKGATNDDKIIMHGFDTKTSFRGK